uniref:Kazal-like domain-containing protein n=1 Tax=Chromera velia CCMP2878 TaxID=1169474 RepID=A0A0G4HGR9_9ALVE|eukprot:Cvel_6785.t1-p1 / transcript=Cvel_6785.t1 / gene=Cvel_6785 / organism=Chromera_velia_CCMP2878 / gene_product=Four-domain proteases inhibitor, putative / transcript_product=Four-domain proteases inhibitor, putative / location=Cvel_scaffold341:12192-15741(-) / protein_length=778 / sequence_SO=supercontig / SO=protein_coding / is_pseudo=false
MGFSVASVGECPPKELEPEHLASHSSSPHSPQPLSSDSYASHNDPCARVCPEENRHPVCDSNSHSHPSRCAFEIAQCKAGGPSALSIAHQGRCEGEAEVHSRLCEGPLPLCLSRWDPVCGSDGRTYASECHFRRKQCEGERSGLRLEHRGPCHHSEVSKEKLVNVLPEGGILMRGSMKHPRTTEKKALHRVFREVEEKVGMESGALPTEEAVEESLKRAPVAFLIGRREDKRPAEEHNEEEAEELNGCRPEMVGNGHCDEECESERWMFDGADCGRRVWPDVLVKGSGENILPGKRVVLPSSTLEKCLERDGVPRWGCHAVLCDSVCVRDSSCRAFQAIFASTEMVLEGTHGGDVSVTRHHPVCLLLTEKHLTSGPLTLWKIEDKPDLSTHMETHPEREVEGESLEGRGGRFERGGDDWQRKGETRSHGFPEGRMHRDGEMRGHGKTEGRHLRGSSVEPLPLPSLPSATLRTLSESIIVEETVVGLPGCCSGKKADGFDYSGSEEDHGEGGETHNDETGQKLTSWEECSKMMHDNGHPPPECAEMLIQGDANAGGESGEASSDIMVTKPRNPNDSAGKEGEVPEFAEKAAGKKGGMALFIGIILGGALILSLVIWGVCCCWRWCRQVKIQRKKPASHTDVEEGKQRRMKEERSLLRAPTDDGEELEKGGNRNEGPSSSSSSGKKFFFGKAARSNPTVPPPLPPLGTSALLISNSELVSGADEASSQAAAGKGATNSGRKSVHFHANSKEGGEKERKQKRRWLGLRKARKSLVVPAGRS